MTNLSIYSDLIDGSQRGFEKENLDTFHPRPGCLLVAVDDPETVTKGGIILPETALGYEVRWTGTIVKLGSELPEYLTVGLRVMFTKGTGEDVAFRGMEKRVMKLFDWVKGPDCPILGWFDS